MCENFAYPTLMKYFEEISAIPRASYHEQKITEYLVEFAKMRGLEYYCDGIGNVLINLPASKGRENDAPILLQGHTDMVCEKESDVEHDFSKDPLKLYVKDGWLRAEGTTLGADDGVAVAAMLAILDGAASDHASLQCLFTVSEEVGLDGAKGFDYSRIYARKMINMDSADEGLIIVGCAGGLRSNVDLPIDREALRGERMRIRVSGLFGGHSGEDIHRGRANAIKILGRVMLDLSRCDESMRLVSICGGTKENAIPRETEAIIVTEHPDRIDSECRELSSQISSELCHDDARFSLTVDGADGEGVPMSRGSTERVVFLVSTVANGVFAMNYGVDGLVEYSRNLGIVETEEDRVSFVFNSRSSYDSRIDASSAELDAYASLLGGESKHYNRYPGWTYSEDSAIRREYTEAYRSLFGCEPKIEVIHAGLECGIIKQAIPDMDMLSCGPVVVNLHSPDEALNIASFERFFSVILKVIQ